MLQECLIATLAWSAPALPFSSKECTLGMDLAVQTTQWSLARCFSSTYVPSLQFHSTKPFVLPCSSHSSSKSRHSLICNDKKGSSYTSSAFMEPPLKNPEEANFTLENTEQADEEYEKETPEEFTEDFTDGTLAYDKAYFDKWLQDEEEDEDIQVGDGGEGGGILLAGTWWDKEALRLAEEVSHSFNNDLKLYAFKTKRNSSIYLRIEKLSTKYGSPSLEDIQAFCSALQLRLDKAEGDGTIPEDMFLKMTLNDQTCGRYPLRMGNMKFSKAIGVGSVLGD